jgi:hypothetical protein
MLVYGLIRASLQIIAWNLKRIKTVSVRPPSSTHMKHPQNLYHSQYSSTLNKFKFAK